jgi:WD40 repeat protein
MKRKYEDDIFVSQKRAKYDLQRSIIDSPKTIVSFLFQEPSHPYGLKQLFAMMRTKITEKQKKWSEKIVISRATGFQVWDFLGDRLIADVDGKDEFGDVIAILELRNGYIVTGTDTGRIVIWDHNLSPSRVIYGHSKNVYCLAQLSDGNLASGTVPNEIKVWNVETGTCIETFSDHESSPVMDLVQARNDTLVSCCSSSIYVWNYGKGTCARVLQETSGCVNTIVALQNGTVVTGNSMGTVTLWDIHSGKMLKCVDKLGGSIFDVVDIGNSKFASSINTNKIIIWNYDLSKVRELRLDNSMCNMYMTKFGFFIFEHGRTFELWDIDKQKKCHSMTVAFEVDAMALLFYK